MSDTTTPRTRADADQLEQHIDQKRGDISKTLDQLEQRLSPGQLVDQTMNVLREHGGGMAEGLSRSVRNNPLPLLLTGVGLAWLMASQSSSDHRYQPHRSAAYDRDDYDRDYDTDYDIDYEDEYRTDYRYETAEYPSAADSGRDLPDDESSDGLVDTLQEKAGSVADSVRGAGSSAGSRARDARRHAARRAREWHRQGRQGAEDVGMQARSAARRARSYFDEEPLVAGALGVALGAVIGSLVPPTRIEDQHVGETSDQVTDRVRDEARSATSRTREKVEEAADEANRSIKSSIDEQRPGSESATPSDKQASPA